MLTPLHYHRVDRGAVTASAGQGYDGDGEALSYSSLLDSEPADSVAVIDKPGPAK